MADRQLLFDGEDQAANLRPSWNLDHHVEDVLLGIGEERNVMPWRDGHVRIRIGCGKRREARRSEISTQISTQELDNELAHELGLRKFRFAMRRQGKTERSLGHSVDESDLHTFTKLIQTFTCKH